MSWLESVREAIRRRLFVWRVFVASLRSDSTLRDEDYSPEERWWDPQTRPTRADEETAICLHCNKSLGRSTVKICPSCKVMLHAACYEDTEGGNAYATEACDACRHRTYWR